MPEISRRGFVRTTAATTLTASSYSRILGATERNAIAVIGSGAPGAAHVRTVHNLSWGRAAWAAFLPPVILGLIFGIIGGVGGAALVPTLINNLSAGRVLGWGGGL